MEVVMVYGLWYGGSSYSAPSVEDVEFFETVEQAIDEFFRRKNNQRVYPCVDEETCSMQIFIDNDPRVALDPYPDSELVFSNGSVQVNPL